jgi:uncharacterized protein involved in outer membrane biogenesis
MASQARAAAGAAWNKLKATPWARIGAWTSGIFAVLVLAVAVFISFADWNALRGPIGRMASTATGRQVIIEGDLHVYPWSLTPRLHGRRLRIGNQQRFANRGQFAAVSDADMKIKLLPLLLGRFDIVSLDLNGADVALYRSADGDANWMGAPAAARAGAPVRAPAIRHLSIRDGHVVYRDDDRNLTLDAVFTTEQTNIGGGRFALQGQGHINAEPFSLLLTGDPLINVRKDRPYPFVADVRAGPTHIEAQGAIARPFDFGTWNADVIASGRDLADLYQLTGLTLPNTPPFALSGKFDRAGKTLNMRDIAGRIGRSDLHGAFSATHQNDGRLFLDGDFSTASLDLDDLLAVLGGRKSSHAARTVTIPASGGALGGRTEVSTAAPLMPDAKLDIHRVRNMDARVSFRAAHVSSNRFQLRGFAVDVGLDHGLLRLDPMTLQLAQGRIGGAVSLNARESVPLVNADVRLSNARLESIVALRGDPPLTGSLLGRARLSGRGASVREAAAHADGDVTLVTPHGEVREAFAELTGINVTRGLGLLLSHNQDKIAIRCGVASFHVDNGVARANTFTFDTQTMLVHGRGAVSLRDETLDLELRGQPKRPRLVRLAAPITIRGPWGAPHIGVEAGRAAGQGLVALLAAVAAPVATILPFVDPGLAKDADCGMLLAAGTAPRAPEAQG